MFYLLQCRQMSPIGKLLCDHFTIELPEVVTRQVSADGTRKYLVKVAGGHEVEVVYIPEEGRGTLCIGWLIRCPNPPQWPWV
jgi:23S rRNA (adenine2503-C2)-methyltransferase